MTASGIKPDTGIENLFGRVKDWTRIILRKDKTSRSYAAFISLAFALINIHSVHRP